MLKKLFYFFTIILLLSLYSQCFNKCRQKNFLDTVDVKFIWQPNPLSVDLDGFDIEKAYGFVAHVPNQQATYFMNAEDGACSKFTEENNGLKSKNIDKLPAFKTHNSFFFTAGTAEELSLFWGNIESNQLTLYQLQSDSWQAIFQSENLQAYYPQLTFQADNFVAGCSMTDDGIKKGVVFFVLKAADDSYKIGTLVFNPEDKKLVAKSITSANNYDKNANNLLIGAQEIQPKKLLVGQLNSSSQTNKKEGNFDLLIFKDDKFEATELNCKAPKGTPKVQDLSQDKRSKLEFFSFTVDTKISFPKILISLANANEERILASLKEDYTMYPLELPDALAKGSHGRKKNLLVPFANCVYLLSALPKEENKEGQEEDKVGAYKAKLEFAANIRNS